MASRVQQRKIVKIALLSQQVFLPARSLLIIDKLAQCLAGSNMAGDWRCEGGSQHITAWASSVIGCTVTNLVSYWSKDMKWRHKPDVAYTKLLTIYSSCAVSVCEGVCHPFIKLLIIEGGDDPPWISEQGLRYQPVPVAVLCLIYSTHSPLSYKLESYLLTNISVEIAMSYLFIIRQKDGVQVAIESKSWLLLFGWS